jgi:hypothetical protein
MSHTLTITFAAVLSVIRSMLVSYVTAKETKHMEFSGDMWLLKDESYLVVDGTNNLCDYVLIVSKIRQEHWALKENFWEYSK